MRDDFEGREFLMQPVIGTSPFATHHKDVVHRLTVDTRNNKYYTAGYVASIIQSL